MEVFADVLEGHLNIITNGGNGNKGQDGTNGKDGLDSPSKVRDVSRILVLFCFVYCSLFCLLLFMFMFLFFFCSLFIVHCLLFCLFVCFCCRQVMVSLDSEELEKDLEIHNNSI